MIFQAALPDFLMVAAGLNNSVGGGQFITGLGKEGQRGSLSKALLLLLLLLTL